MAIEVRLAGGVGIDRRPDRACRRAAYRSLGKPRDVVGVVFAAEAFRRVGHHIGVIMRRVGLQLAPGAADCRMFHAVPEYGGDFVALGVIGRFPFDDGGEYHRLVKAHLDIGEALSVGIGVMYHFLRNPDGKIIQKALDDRFWGFTHIECIGIGVKIAFQRIFPLLQYVV